MLPGNIKSFEPVGLLPVESLGFGPHLLDPVEIRPVRQVKDQLYVDLRLGGVFSDNCRQVDAAVVPKEGDSLL